MIRVKLKVSPVHGEDQTAFVEFDHHPTFAELRVAACREFGSDWVRLDFELCGAIEQEKHATWTITDRLRKEGDIMIHLSKAPIVFVRPCGNGLVDAEAFAKDARELAQEIHALCVSFWAGRAGSTDGA